MSTPSKTDKPTPTPFPTEGAFYDALAWEPIEQHPESPIYGDVIMYRDGKVAVVGNSSQVSYGERAQMQAVARLFPRPEPVAADDSQDDARTSLDQEVDS